MKFKNDVPIYLQIANDIKEQIVSGRLQENEKLPSVREYSVSYEVTGLTIQRAMQQLESEEVIETKRGIGNFIREGSKKVLQKEMVGCQVQEFITRMRSMGIMDDEIIRLIKGGVK